MAETIELFFVGRCYLDMINFLQINLSKEYFLNEIFCIDNWEWDNLKKIDNNFAIYNELCHGKIICLDIASPKCENLGIYIEKYGNNFVYCFWGDTKIFSPLSLERNLKSTRVWYNHLYTYLIDILTLYKLDFKYIAIGIESKFQYYEDMSETINKSKNISSWIINNKVELQFDKCLNEYVKRELPIINSTLWECFQNE